MKEILNQIKLYIDQKQSNKTWQAGKDFVNYAGPYFGSEEYVSAVETLLNGWLALADKGLQFEREMPKYFGKKYGVLTASKMFEVVILKSRSLKILPKCN